MNKIYKVIWSKAKNCYVVVSEIAKRNSKRSSGVLGSVVHSALAGAVFLSLIAGVCAPAWAETLTVDTSVSDTFRILRATTPVVVIDVTANGGATFTNTNGRNFFSVGAESGMSLINNNGNTYFSVDKSGKVKFGEYATATGNGAFAAGHGSAANPLIANGEGAVAFGVSTNATGNYSSAWGYSTTANGTDATAFGYQTTAVGNGATAWGFKSHAGLEGQKADNATAFGQETQALADEATAWGHTTTAKGKQSTAWGNKTQAIGELSTAFGQNSVAEGTHAIAGGFGVSASAAEAVAFGKDTVASGIHSFAMGEGSKATKDHAVALGWNAEASGKHSFATGQNAVAKGDESVALGYHAAANEIYSYAFGANAIANGSGSVALGTGSVATAPDTSHGGYSISGYSKGSASAGTESSIESDYVWKPTDTGYGNIAVGDASKGVTHRITGLAAGYELTDAVNVAQLVDLKDQIVSSTSDWQLADANGKINSDGTATAVYTPDDDNIVTLNVKNGMDATAAARTYKIDLSKLVGGSYGWNVQTIGEKVPVNNTDTVKFEAGNGIIDISDVATEEGVHTIKISAKDTTYTAGEGIEITNKNIIKNTRTYTLSGDGDADTPPANLVKKYTATLKENGVDDAGTAVFYDTDTKYTAGTGIEITNNNEIRSTYTWDVGVAANGEQSAYKSKVAGTQQVQFVAGSGVTITGAGDDTAATKTITISTAPVEDIHLAGISVDENGNLTFNMSDNTTKYTVNLKGTGGTTVTGDGNNTVTINSTEGGGGGHSDYSTVAGDGQTTIVTPEPNSSSQTNYVVTGSVVAGDEADPEGETGDTKSIVTYKDGKGVVTIHNELNGEPTTTVTIDGITDTKVTGGSVVEGDNGKYNINLTNNIDASTVTIKDLHDYYLDLNKTTYNSTDKTIHLELNNGDNKDLVLDNLISNEDTLWTSQVNGDKVQDIKAGGKQNFVDGKNIKVTKDGADIKISTDTDVEFDNVTVNKTVKVGDTLIEGDKITTNTVNTQTINLGDTTITEGDDNRITYNTKSGDTYNIATLEDGMDFAGDDGKAIHKNLAEQLDVVGGAKDKASEYNIYTYNDGDKLRINLAKDIDGVDSITVNKTINVGGDTTITGDTITTKTFVAGDTTINNDGLKIKNGPSVTKNGVDAGGKKITNVAPGEDGTDAVNVDQLNDAISQVGGDAINRLGDQVNHIDNRMKKGLAGAAALAALHPLDFDPDDKWEFSAGVGNYRGETAAAIGAFYHPNDDTIFSLGATVGNGENLVNGGVTFRFGQQNHQSRSKKAMAKEIVELRAEVAELKAMVYSMANGRMPGLDLTKSEEFPDTPENHWAYDYVSVLAGNGVLEGYQDGFFKGDRTLTRYEMAAIIYRAMMRGVDVDERMKEEFAPELARVKVDTLTSHSDGTPSIQRVRVIKGRE